MIPLLWPLIEFYFPTFFTYSRVRGPGKIGLTRIGYLSADGAD